MPEDGVESGRGRVRGVVVPVVLHRRVELVDGESRARDLRADAAVHEQDGTQLQRHRLLAQPFADHRVGGEGVAVAAHRVERVEVVCVRARRIGAQRSEEHTSELQSLMRISYAVFCLQKKKYTQTYQK